MVIIAEKQLTESANRNALNLCLSLAWERIPKGFDKVSVAFNDWRKLICEIEDTRGSQNGTMTMLAETQQDGLIQFRLGYLSGLTFEVEAKNRNYAKRDEIVKAEFSSEKGITLFLKKLGRVHLFF